MMVHVPLILSHNPETTTTESTSTFKNMTDFPLKTIPEAQSVRFLCSDSDNNAAVEAASTSPYHNHHLINTSRISHSLQPLRRTVHLDSAAKAHAHSMADRRMLFHSVNSIKELRDKLQSFHAGENVQRGTSILQMHQECMSPKSGFLRANILSRDFDEMGMGTAVGTDGIVYLVQVFRAMNA
jgi:uncharacterized protein YkwD